MTAAESSAHYYLVAPGTRQTCKWYGFRHSLIVATLMLNNLQELCLQYKNARLEKLQLLNFVFAEIDPPCKSFADLGGNWNVDGCYTHFALDNYDVERAFLIDTDFADSTIERSKSYKNLQVLNGNFGDASTIDAIPSVDVMFLFDVLLHQVRPNWDEILRLYSAKTKVMAIYNQQFTNFQNTTRLLDLGWEEMSTLRMCRTPAKSTRPCYRRRTNSIRSTIALIATCITTGNGRLPMMI